MHEAEGIMRLLEGLKKNHGSIRACMVAKRGLEGLIMFPQSFKEEVAGVWEPLSKNVDDMLLLVSRYSQVGLNRSYTEILGYGVFFLALPGSDTALIAFVKEDDPLKEAAQITAQMEKTRSLLLDSL